MFVLKEKLIFYNYKQTITPSLPLETIRDYNKKRKLGPQKRICNAPFKNMYFKTNGNVTACCLNDVEIFGNTKEQDLKKIWNGKKANFLRQKIDNYNLNTGCSICEHFLKSKNYSAFLGGTYDSFFENRKNEYPTEMTFEISNTCNLECIMCNEKLSSLIRKNKYHLNPINKKYDEHFFEELKEFLPYLNKARFVGGEPFLINEFYQLFDFLIQYNPNCKIAIQTNGTILNEKVKKIIQHKNVELSISIDSLKKETYEAIRQNANFEKVMNNINYFKTDAINHNKLININFCVMANNWQEIPDIIAYCNQNSFLLQLIPVEHPSYLSLKALKATYLKNIIEKLYSKVYNTTIPQNEVYIQIINYISNLENYTKAQQEKKNKLILKPVSELYNELRNLFSVVSDYFANKHLLNEDTLISTIQNTLKNTDTNRAKQVIADIIIQTEETKGKVILNESTEQEILATIRVQVEDLLKKDYELCY